MIAPVASVKFEHRGSPYFVLVLKAEKQFRTGFRYIKELLVHGHNFKLMQAYDRLDQAGVKIYSAKTDCFTIPAESEAKAREVLSFDQGIGSCRASKTSDIIFRLTTYTEASSNTLNSNTLKPNSSRLTTSGT